MTLRNQKTLGAVHKRRRNFLAVLIPPPPCRNFDPDLPNFHLLISCNIGIWDPPPPLKYFDVFYGWPLRRMTKDDDGSSFKRLGSSSIITAIWVLAGRNVGMYLILVGLRIGLDSWRVRKYSTKIFILSKCWERCYRNRARITTEYWKLFLNGNQYQNNIAQLSMTKKRSPREGWYLIFDNSTLIYKDFKKFHLFSKPFYKVYGRLTVFCQKKFVRKSDDRKDAKVVILE